MKKIIQTVEKLELLSVDMRRSANELDTILQNIKKASRDKVSRDFLNGYILEQSDARKYTKEQHGLVNLDKQEKKLWKQLEKIIKKGS